ncbi:MAG TPA: hypothetical protein VFL51_03980 [Pseudolabrys sp.]|nr:hypothetical protein [Pseudolabrys sp.]
MLRFAPYALGALLSAFIAGYWTGSEPTAAHAATFASRWLGFSQTQGRQDRLAFHRVALRRAEQVRSIERSGKDGATVVYRDRAGSVVFRNDPHTRSTVAVKGVVFPSVPAGGIHVAPRKPAPPQTAPQKLMDGCEPALSPLASREASAFGGRCIASIETGAAA